MSKSGLSRFVVGAGIGFGIGLLVAAKSGRDARNDIKIRFEELEKKIKNLSYDDIKEGTLIKLDELKVMIEDLDEEKASSLIKEKISLIREKLIELSKYIKRKSAPTIKKLINEINEKLDVLDDKTVINDN